MKTVSNMTATNLAHWIWLHFCLWGWLWVQREQCPCHPDVPERVLRIRQLREEIAHRHPTRQRSLTAIY